MFINTLNPRKGMGRMASISITLVLAIVFVLSYLVFDPFYNNWKLGNMLRGIAQQSTNMENDDQIKVYAMEALTPYGFNFKPDEIVITRQERKIHIAVQYKVLIKIPLTNLGFNLAFSQDGSNTI